MVAENAGKKEVVDSSNDAENGVEEGIVGDKEVFDFSSDSKTSVEEGIVGDKEVVDSSINAEAGVEGMVRDKELVDSRINAETGIEEGIVGDKVERETEPKETYNIVFVSAEAAPYSKTGGLGDVCGSLPCSLASRGHRVMVISPRYLNGDSDKVFAHANDVGCHINISCFGTEQEVAFFHEYRAGVDWVCNFSVYLYDKKSICFKFQFRELYYPSPGPFCSVIRPLVCMCRIIGSLFKPCI